MRVSEPCARAIRRAKKIAKFLGSVTLMPEHFMIAMIKTKNAATRFLRKAGIALREVRAACLKEIPRSKEYEGTEPCRSDSWNTVIGRAATLAQNGKRNSIGIFDVFAAFTETNGIFACISDACEAAVSMIRQFLEYLVVSERKYAAA